MLRTRWLPFYKGSAASEASEIPKLLRGVSWEFGVRKFERIKCFRGDIFNEARNSIADKHTRKPTDTRHRATEI